MAHHPSITLRLDRRLIEHPRALHAKRMRGAIWLYLALLARLPEGSDTLDIDPERLGQAMGLSEGTIRSYLGHLRKGRYVAVRRLNGSVRVRVNRLPVPTRLERSATSRIFTVEKLEQALGEDGSRNALEASIVSYPDSVIQQALAGALAVPAREIRRSRTALFLYLLKRHAQD
jgi:hypothetical protein